MKKLSKLLQLKNRRSLIMNHSVWRTVLPSCKMTHSKIKYGCHCLTEEAESETPNTNHYSAPSWCYGWKWITVGVSGWWQTQTNFWLTHTWPHTHTQLFHFSFICMQQFQTPPTLFADTVPTLINAHIIWSTCPTSASDPSVSSLHMI